jgi:type I site-specific restriction endonuclease
MRALRTSRLVRLFWDRARFPVAEIVARDAEQLARLVDLRATGDGHTRTPFALVVRLNVAGDVQAIEFLNRLFLPTSPDF